MKTSQHRAAMLVQRGDAPWPNHLMTPACVVRTCSRARISVSAGGGSIKSKCIKSLIPSDLSINTCEHARRVLEERSRCDMHAI
eukprot:4555569-Pleurochrysis_carterae.AAC.1